MKKWLLRFLGNIGSFLRALLERGFYELLEQVLPVALEVVTAIQNNYADLPGEEKRKKAFNLLKRRLIGAGINVSTSILNLAIEMAVQKLKALQAEEEENAKTE